MRLILMAALLVTIVQASFAKDEITLACEAKEIYSAGKTYPMTGKASLVITEFDVQLRDWTFLITDKSEYEIRGTAITENATMEIQIDRVTGEVRHIVGRNVITYTCAAAERQF